MRRQPGQNHAALFQRGEQGGHRTVDFADGQEDPLALAADVAYAGHLPQPGVGGVFAVLQGELDDVLRPEGSDELARSSEGDHSSVIDDRDSIAEPLCFFHVVGGQQDGAAGPLEIQDEIPELSPRLGIESGGRLVEEQELGVADEGGGHGEALLLAAGEPGDPSAALLFEPDDPHDVFNAAAPVEEAAEKSERLLYGQLFGELSLLELHAETLPQSVIVRAPTHPEDLDVAGIRLQQPLQNLDGRRLAGSVGPQKPEALADEDLEIEAVHGHDIAVSLGKAAAAERAPPVAAQSPPANRSFFLRTGTRRLISRQAAPRRR